MKRLRQFFCRHVFVGLDLQPRSADGKVTWPCSKCGKVYRVDYGLQISDFGRIAGPWIERGEA